jgi:hypothetical protein
MTLVRTVRSACSRSSHHSARYLTLLPCCLAKKMIRLVAVSPCHRTSSCKVTRLVTVQGDSFPLGAEAVPVLQRETAPPGHLTESELIALMERHGIGVSRCPRFVGPSDSLPGTGEGTRRVRLVRGKGRGVSV